MAAFHRGQTSGLLGLVDEIILSIIDFVDSQQALCNLSITCSFLRTLTEPLIWRKLQVTNGSHAQRLAGAFETQEDRVNHVHELSIRYPYDRATGISELNYYLGLMSKLRKLTIESPCPNNSEWSKIDVFDGETRIDYTRLLEAAVYPTIVLPPPLQMLQSLTLHGHASGASKFALGRRAVMFFHPSLRRITLSCADFVADLAPESIPEEKDSSTPLQSLTLIECNVNVQFLDVILRLPKALKELSIGERYHTFPECRPSRDSRTRTSQHLFVSALCRQAHSLEKVAHFSGRLGDLASRIEEGSPAHRFRELDTLRHLELDLESCLWHYVLQGDYPRSVDTIKVTDTAWSNNVRDGETSLRHPGRVLRRCQDIYSRILSHPTDFVVRFNSSMSKEFFTAFHSPQESEIITAYTGSAPRCPIYELSRAVQAKGKRLTMSAFCFPDDRLWIPPYMYGEEEPEEVQFYDSARFWHVGRTNFQSLDDEDFINRREAEWTDYML